MQKSPGFAISCALAIVLVFALLQRLSQADARAATGPDVHSFVLRAPMVGADNASGFGLIAWDLDPAFDSSQETYIRQSLEAALQQAHADFGQVESDFTVVAYMDAHALATKRAEWEHLPVASIGERYVCDFCAETVFDAMFVHVGAGWTNDLAFPLKIGRQTIAHEFFHIIQYRAMGKTRVDSSLDPAIVRPAGPTWLIEGSAHWWGWRVAVHSLGVSASTLLNHEKPALSLDQTPLELMESPNAFYSTQRAYSIGLLAVDFLMATRPPQALLEYFQDIGAGLSWQEAFVRAFGMPISAFYQQFSDYRTHP